MNRPLARARKTMETNGEHLFETHIMVPVSYSYSYILYYLTVGYYFFYFALTHLKKP